MQEVYIILWNTTFQGEEYQHNSMCTSKTEAEKHINDLQQSSSNEILEVYKATAMKMVPKGIVLE